MEDKTITIRKEVFALANSASKDRYNIDGVYIDSEKKRAVATNGHILAIRELPDLDASESILLKCKAKAKLKRNEPVELYSLNGNANATVNPQNSCEYKTTNDFTYPDVDQVIPPESELSGHVVRLNAKLLYSLAQSLGSDEIVLHLNNSELGPIKVTTKNPMVQGLIMPIKG